MKTESDVGFAEWMRSRIEAGPMPAEEVVQALVPLLRQVGAVHDQSKVAPLAGLDRLRVANGTVYFAALDALDPSSNREAVALVEGRDPSAVEVERRTTVDTTGVIPQVRSRSIVAADARIVDPAYVSGYMSWEHVVGHHDALTDIFSLGMILATLALGLDFSVDESLESYVQGAGNPFTLHERLHPVLGRCMMRMTELHRRKRVQDLSSVTALLANHREQSSQSWTLGVDASVASPRSRRQRIHERLRDRLFDCSRRNRLLYYRQTLAQCNLTVASVPAQLDAESIRADELCTWQGAFADAMLEAKPVNLGRWLRIEEASYLPGLLERIRADERHDKNEYGSSQLRLVVAFFRWHDLKEDKATRIASPLLLLPVALERKKGVRDAWTLTAPATVAEVNPALRHRLRQLYGLELPETVDLSETSIAEFHQRLQAVIQASEPGVTVRLIDRPRIDLVLQRARARVEHHRRKARLTGRGVRRVNDIDYSYDRENFRPLGLQIFLSRIKTRELPLSLEAGDQHGDRRVSMVAPEEGGDAIRTRETYVIKEDSESNPYAWDVDLCNVTLGNFNYRKMSLVRDYRSLLEQDRPHPAFDGVFSDTVRARDALEGPHGVGATDLWPVVFSDPTQDAAVARARSSASYVIQGPPGTGKSQTITNLIADQVARGKRVLFVCAKRAALDVVHHRLAQRGLDRLCCIIHDTQADKKPFIADLRSHYEDWIARRSEIAECRRERERLMAEIASAIEPLQKYAEAMVRVDPREGVSVRSLISRLIETQTPEAIEDAQAAAGLSIPAYGAWTKHAAAIQALSAALSWAKAPVNLASTGLRHARRDIFAQPEPSRALLSRADACTAALARVEAAIATAGLTLRRADAPIGELLDLVVEAKRLRVLSQRDLLRLLDRADPVNEELRAAVRRRAELAAAAAAAAAKTVNWIDMVPVGDCQALLEQVSGCERAALRVLMPAWWRLRKLLHARYRFAAHVVPPRWSAIVKELMAHHAAAAALKAADREFAARWKVDDLKVLVDVLAEIHGQPVSATARSLREQVRTGGATDDAMSSLIVAEPAFAHVIAAVAAVFGEAAASFTMPYAVHALDELARDAPLLAHTAAALRECADAPADVWEMLSRLKLPPARMEAVVLRRALEAAERNDRHLPGLDGHALEAAAARLRERHQGLLDLNARMILADAHDRFLERVRRSSQSGAETPAERDWRRQYARGRRELEHEFGKVMRYRSIRDLADGDSGRVVADLKPVWLMSPLSVSDALPLDGSGFDVVVYDEASQIPIEEAVPALHRAPQSIVVGDRQQLPPTDFFSASGQEDEVGEGGKAEQHIAIEHDSFLTQAASNLPGVMLGWHYRSRSESLIAFSNAAFYEGRLLTIPDVALPHAGGQIAVEAPEQGIQKVGALLARPVSYHRLTNSPYLDRRNAGEARYIAHLLMGLLASDKSMSVGIVAFSEAQQTEIESAVAALAQADAVFRDRFEAELQREEDGQFCGLFIKNLENVQGDERDIIILSVCYGPDPSGRMHMNFGPINQSGGEKRLNVVFSRARHHMAVVTSIDAGQITNDFNDGANAMKRYLAFAAAHSCADFAAASRVLTGLADGVHHADGNGHDPVADALAAALALEGFAVVRGIGGSRMRCDIAVTVTGETAYRVGVLIDHEHAYRDQSVWERDLVRPASLSRFGWRIVRVFARDWIHNPSQVLDGVRRHVAAAPKRSAQSAS